MVVTGGTAGSHVLATKYNLDGWLEDLPDLNHGRRNHACTWYRADEGDLVYLVAGGWDKRGEQPISDTEMLSSDSSLWSLKAGTAEFLDLCLLTLLATTPAIQLDRSFLRIGKYFFLFF